MEKLKEYIKGHSKKGMGLTGSEMLFLAREACEAGIINAEDMLDIYEDIQAGGFFLCHAMNVLLYRAYRGYS